MRPAALAVRAMALAAALAVATALAALPEWGALDVSENCTSDLLHLALSFKNGSIWAIKMFDSSTKFPDGVLFGNLVHMGNFDECLSVRRGEGGGAGPPFDAQHCLVSAVVPISASDAPAPEGHWRAVEGAVKSARAMTARGNQAIAFSVLPLQVAWCTPSSCTPQEVETIASAAVSLTRLNATLTVAPNQCHTHVGKTLRSIDVFAICVLSLFIGCAVASTAYDVFTRQREQRPPLLLAFSVYSNVPKLLAVTKNRDHLGCLNGIRTISICWVVLGHVYLMNAASPTLNIIDYAPDFLKSFKRLVITNGTLSVDSFFLMSGLLLSFLFLKEVQRTNRFHIVKFYVHRYLRLTPALAILLLLTVTLLGYSGTGPLWDVRYDPGRKACETNWWTNLIYVNNYVHSDNMCLGHTWYLAVDMQLHWLSPLVLLPLWKLPKRYSLAWVGFLLLAGWAIPFTIVYVKELAPFMAVAQLEKLPDSMKYYYYPMHTRYVPWLQGVLLGYILREARRKKPEFSSGKIVVGWILSFTLMMVALYGAYPFQQPDHTYNRLEAAFWLSQFRTIWSMGLAWIIFACDQGYGGIINHILSWNFFQPLSRLCYGIYLLHVVILEVNSGVVQSPMYLADVNIIPQFFGVLLMSVAWTIPMVLLFESPIILIEKTIFGKQSGEQGEQHMEYETLDNNAHDCREA